MLDWKKPGLGDRDRVSLLVKESGYIGCDASFANIYLYQKEYSLLIAETHDMLVRYYMGHDNWFGYTFPLGKGDVLGALGDIREDAYANGREICFCGVTEEQKHILEEVFGEKISFTSSAGDSDYIYLRTDLAELQGKAYHKKKNHVSKFMREYPSYEYVPMTGMNAHKAITVEQQWFEAFDGDEDDPAAIEHEVILDAIDNFEELGLIGGLILVDGEPVAMTMASDLGNGAADIHYEKAIGEYADNGAYAAINNFFAKSHPEFLRFNREEDMGIEGLRLAKESYHPSEMLNKFNAVVK